VNGRQEVAFQRFYGGKGPFSTTDGGVMKVFVPLISIGLAIFIWGTGCSKEEEAPPPEKKHKIVQKIIKPPPEPIKNSIPDKKPKPVVKEVLEAKIQTGKEAGSNTPKPDILEKGVTSGKESGVYVVKKGESLSSISGQAEVYGNPLNWPVLFRYNIDKLSGLKWGEDLPDKMIPEDIRLKIVTPEEVKENLKERADKFWVINIISTTTGKEVVPSAIKLIRGGYAVYITSATVKGKPYQRLRVGFFTNQAEAAAAGKKVMSLLKTTEFWPTTVTKNEHEAFAGY
jgi:hypothetical protein